MKKLLVILSLILLSGIAIGSGITRSTFIKTGYTMLSTPFVCTTADTITTSQTYTILITNLQQFQQHQQFYFDVTNVSGSPSIVITAYGKVTESGAWVAIGSAITWTSDSNDGYITSTTPINYNYFKIEMVASGATQKSYLHKFEVKTSNAAAIPANSGTYTFARATTGTITLTSQDNDANCALTIGAGGTGALTLGDANSTTAITSSDWAIGATGAMTGIGAITADGLITGTAGATISGATTSINASSNFATNIGTGTTTSTVTIGGGSNGVAVNSNTWDITAAGVFTGMLRNVLTDATGTKSLASTDANCVLFVTKSDGATTVTIPDPSAATVGVIYYIIQTADQNLVLTATSANSNSLVCDGVATSDNVTISTASHKIGAGMIVIGISATQWFVGGLNPESLLTPEAAD